LKPKAVQKNIHHLSEIGSLLSLISILGRFPISININKSTGGFRGSVKAIWKRFDFFLVTLLLLLALFMCSLNLWLIFTSHDDTETDKYGNDKLADNSSEYQDYVKKTSYA
jgi:hypothetical protein